MDALLTKDPAKLAVYTSGYDSHAYNTYFYWPDKFPHLKVVEEEKCLRTFKLEFDGQVHYLVEGDEVVAPDGRIMKVEDICS